MSHTIPLRFTLAFLALGLSIALQAQVHDAADQVRPLLPGMSVPTVTLADTDGQAVALDPDGLDRPLVITFYRGGWCPYCNLHLAELRHAEQRLRDLGFEVWFISPDRPDLLAEGSDAAEGYRLLSDADASVTEAFGIAFRVDDETHAQYQGFGVDIDERSGVANQILPVAATFLIGTDGIIQFAYVNPDYTVRLAPEVLIAAGEAYMQDAHQRLQRERNR